MKISKSIIIILCILLMPLSLFTEEDRGIGVLVEELSKGSVIGKQYLLIIGINDYKHWVPLRHPVKDAKEIRDILKSRYYIDEIIELYDATATKANILKTFEHLQQRLKGEDSLLIFYAGHGHLDKKTDSGFWIPVDAQTDVYSQINWLPNTQIRGSISKMESRHILIIADSCFSGDILKTERSQYQLSIDIEYFKKAYARISRQVLTSGAQETVPDKSEFSYQLKMALKANQGKYLDPLILFTEIRLGVTKTSPLFGVLADTGHQTEASFLLFRKPEVKVPDKLCTLYISTQTGGMLYLDNNKYGEIPAGMTEIQEVKPGTHLLRIEYESGEQEEQEVELKSGETTDLAFTWIVPEEEPGHDPLEQGSGDQDIGTESVIITESPEITPGTKPFLISVSGAFSTTVGDSLDNVSPLGGCEFTGEWQVFTVKPIVFSLTLGQWYIYHPKTGEAVDFNSLQILYSSLGCGMDVSLGSSLPLFLRINLCGGLAIGIVDNEVYAEPVFLLNPGIAAQAGVIYDFSGTLVFIGKAQYLTVVDSGSFADWYKEASVSVGIGIRFGK